jgi:hypothetical protein
MYDETTLATIATLRRMLQRGQISIDQVREIRLHLELEYARDVATVERGDAYRANGQCHCPVCAKTYNEHPASIAYPFLNRLCSGELVKL